MDKYIGIHRKGSIHDNFGFINSSIHTNLFIHDKEFHEDIDLYNGEKVYITYKIRPSKVKKGLNEGYEGKILLSETDSEFLLNELISRISNIKDSYQSNDEEKLCKELICQLDKLKIENSKLNFFKEYFTDSNVEQYIKKKVEYRKFELMRFGIQTFFPEYHEYIEKKINELIEKEILIQMGYEGTDKYDALTDVFFKDFSKFESYFYKFPEIVNKEFIYKIILESESLPFDKSFETIKRFVKIIKKSSQALKEKNVFDLFSNLSTPKIRLYLWLNDLTEKFNFDEYKENIWALERKDQSLFIKKLFFWKSQSKINFTLKDLNDIKVFNIEAFRKIKEIEKDKKYINLDFNVSLMIYILNSISSIVKFDNNFQNKIFEYFIEYVKDYNEIQYIDFFYSQCCGRTRGNKYPQIDQETNKPIINPSTGLPDYEYRYFHDEKDKPIFHKFCDGIKSTDNNLGFPPDKPYWWCASKPCFESSFSKTILDKEYKNWTIKEFLSLLQLPYDENNFSYLLGYINKSNLLLERLRCHGCNKLLHPKGQNKYTYHNINNFYCSDKNCSEFNKIVYLNHCLNKNCGNIIDSRVSKKCTKTAPENSGGWYICDICYSCCSTNTLVKIKENREKNNLPFNGLLTGHDELRTIFCYHCGDEILLDIEFYTRQVEIIKNLINSKQKGFVIKKDENNGNLKFLLNFGVINPKLKNNGIDKLIKNGFKVTQKRDSQNLYSVDRLISVALKCNNIDCQNKEVFSPIKSNKWKAFKDTHDYLVEKIEKFYLTGNIDDLKKIK